MTLRHPHSCSITQTMTMTDLEQALQMEVIELLSLVREQQSQIKELQDELKNLKPKKISYVL